jgi:hypothetical protein
MQDVPGDFPDPRAGPNRDGSGNGVADEAECLAAAFAADSIRR